MIETILTKSHIPFI